MSHVYTDKPIVNSLTGSEEEQRLLKKVVWKIMPVLFIAYFFSFLDRVNIGYAKLQMQSAIGFTDTQYAIAAGIFFIGYALCEIPSNMLMDKIGARKTLTRIMLLWGTLSACTMFVQTINQLYALRILLGIFEAGFVPGVILYFTYWFPSHIRGRITAIFLVATLTAPMIGGPISGVILQYMHGWHGLEGWQWMFLLDALPVFFIAGVIFFNLADKPEEATWLSPQEKALHQQMMQKDREKQGITAGCGTHGKKAMLGALADPKVFLLIAFIFATNCGAYAFNFWLPTMIKEMGVGNIAVIALLGAIPFAMAILGELTICRSSDIRRERRWHFVFGATLAAVSLIAVGYLEVPMYLKLVLLGVAGFGFSGASGISWTFPSTYLDPVKAPAGIAMISMISTSSGFFAPWIMGVTRDMTGSSTAGLYSIAAVLLVSVIIMIFFAPKRAVYVQQPS